MLGCSLYMLTQFILLAIDWSNTDWKEVFFLVGAGLAGGSSLFLVKYEYCWLCQNLGPWSIEVRSLHLLCMDCSFKSLVPFLTGDKDQNLHVKNT